MLMVVAHPTHEQTLAAAQAGNEETIKELETHQRIGGQQGLQSG